MIAASDFLGAYSVKLAEYVIAGTYLLLFIPFWRYASGGAARAPALAAEAARPGGLSSLVGDWFAVPDGLHFHPGHSWARPEEGDIVTVGMDDFAQKLVGRPARIGLPDVGARLEQGEKAWSIVDADKSVCMLSPVDGEVVEVNERVRERPDAVNDDPYGAGWLFKARAPRLRANLSQLNRDEAARRWMQAAADDLRARLGGGLGPTYQDGGVPLPGIARNLDPERWDELARSFFRT